MRVAVVGAGMVSDVYLENLARFDNIRVVACTDLDLGRARAQADKFAIPLVASVDTVIAHPDVELVLNLTTPDAHFAIALAALQADKAVYNEKPLSVEFAEGSELVAAARKAAVLLGAAPDSFFGSMHQSARELIDGGGIGTPVAAAAVMVGPGHERWHPNAAFYYLDGAGPLFDFGPYCVSALVNLLGPVARVSASKREDRTDRVQQAGPLAGRRIAVDVPTHVSGLLEFESGVVASVITTFGVWGTAAPGLEVLGTAGTLAMDSPHRFGGEIRILDGTSRTWSTCAQHRPYSTRFRGVGVADMAIAMRAGRPHRANGELGVHVLEVLHALGDSARRGQHMDVRTRCARPAPLPVGLADGRLD